MVSERAGGMNREGEEKSDWVITKEIVNIRFIKAFYTLVNRIYSNLFFFSEVIIQ